MKVVFFRHSLLSRGGDKMILAHAGYLAKQGWSVEIQTAHVDTVFPLPPEIQIVDLGSRSKAVTLWKSLSRRFDADVVIADIIPLICLLALRNRRRLVYFAQDYDEEYFTSTLAQLFIRLFYRFGLSICKIPVISVSEYLSEIFCSRFRARVFTVNNGVDRDFFYNDPDTGLLAKKGGKKAILVLSRRDARKGSDLLGNIFSAMPTAHLDSVVLWSVGTPLGRTGLKVDAHDFGYVDESSLRRIMSSADLFLYPTRHKGFGLMPLEAMACGCPVVSSTAFKVATHEVNALLSPVGDVKSLAENINRALTEPGLSERLVSAGFELAQDFTLERSTACFAAALVSSVALV